jgi:probable HAF family extracellular repeat protein
VQPGGEIVQEVWSMRSSLPVRFALAGCLLAAAFVAATPAETVAARSYTVTEVGSLVGTGDGRFDKLTNIIPSAINDEGVLLINSVAGAGTFWAIPFTSTDGKIKRLGREKAFSFATEINSAGDVAGYQTGLEDTNFARMQPLAWLDGELTELETPSGIGQAVAINDKGVIVGMAQVDEEGAVRHAVRWDEGKLTDLGTIDDGTSFAGDINGEGVIIGGVTFPDSPQRKAFVIEDGELTELPAPYGLDPSAFEINDAGLIVGMGLDDQNQLHALRWVDGDVERLPGFVEGGASNALDNNEEGLIVGWALVAEGSTSYSAVLWDGDEVFDLNAMIPEHPDYTLTSGQGINNAGQILAVGSYTDGSTGGFLLDPAGTSGQGSSAMLAGWTQAILRD